MVASLRLRVDYSLIDKSEYTGFSSICQRHFRDKSVKRRHFASEKVMRMEPVVALAFSVRAPPSSSSGSELEPVDTDERMV